MKDSISENDNPTNQNEVTSLPGNSPSAPQSVSSSDVLNPKMNDATQEMKNISTHQQEESDSAAPKAIILPSKDVVSQPLSLSGDQEPTTAFPEWYESKTVSSYERKFLPEWFNCSANHRTESSYVITREKILDEARKSSGKYITPTSIRHCVPGDVGSLTRLFEFLMSHGFINGSAINDTAPCPKIPSVSVNEDWSDEQLLSLAIAIKHHSTSDEDHGLSIDWEAVAKAVGHEVTALDCYEKFLATDFCQVQNGSLIPQTEPGDLTSSDNLYSGVLKGIRPDVTKKIVEVALQCTDRSLFSAQKAGIIGSVASKAYECAREEEETTSRLLQEILDQRMAKLENRLSLLDDIEGILEAERMVIELERRDLYTNRCRHWFTGSS
jgi:hypothetical protein